MITKELENYIKEAAGFGMKREEIRKNLLDAGWENADINKAVWKVLPVQKNAKVRVAPVVAMFILGLLFIGGVAYSSRLLLTDIDGYFSEAFSANVYGALLQQQRNDELKNKEKKLLFVGDIMLSKNRGTGRQMKKMNDFRYPFLRIADILKSADIAFGNLEGPISSHGENIGGTYSFRADPRVIQGLKFAGFDVLSIANNHVGDWGKEAFRDTINILQANDISTVGGGLNFADANRPLIKEVGNTKIAFIAYSIVEYDTDFQAKGNSKPGRSFFNVNKIAKGISKLKGRNGADIIIVSFHWGDEYKKRSSKYQQEIAHKLIDAGADLIIGHHPHVVQELERYKNGWIAYSLGNFIFDQSFSEETMNGLILEVKVHNKEIITVNPINIEISDSFQPSIKNFNI
jgi:poly-gamma-glutamate synthesis protein (capsule biosynthesis protein)